METKLEYLFDMYDVDKNGYLDKREVFEVMCGMLELLDSEQSEAVRVKLCLDCFDVLDTSRDGIISKGIISKI